MSSNDMNLELEIKNFEYLWEQGQSASVEGCNTAKKIYKLLKLTHGSCYSTKDILKILTNRLSYLNNFSRWALKNLLRDDIQ